MFRQLFLLALRNRSLIRLIWNVSVSFVRTDGLEDAASNLWPNPCILPLLPPPIPIEWIKRRRWWALEDHNEYNIVETAPHLKLSSPVLVPSQIAVSSESKAVRRAANIKADKGFRHKTDDPNYFIICRMGTTAIDICGRGPIWKKTSTETETINCSENAVGSNVQSQAVSQSVNSHRVVSYTIPTL